MKSHRLIPIWLDRTDGKVAIEISFAPLVACAVIAGLIWWLVR